MKSIEIEIAMMEKLGIRKNIIVPNVSWGIVADLHECDLLALSRNNYATEIEIKVSKSDLMKDKKKKHFHKHNRITYFFFAVPKILQEFALINIPERSGLYTIECVGDRKIVRKVKGCIRNPEGLKWSKQERFKLAELGTMRILKLKKKLLIQEGLKPNIEELI